MFGWSWAKAAVTGSWANKRHANMATLILQGHLRLMTDFQLEEILHADVRTLAGLATGQLQIHLEGYFTGCN